MAGSPMIGGVVTWTETWGVDNIHLLWPFASPSMLNRHTGSFLISTNGVADARVSRSISMLRMWVGWCVSGGEGNRHCS